MYQIEAIRILQADKAAALNLNNYKHLVITLRLFLATIIMTLPSSSFTAESFLQMMSSPLHEYW